MTKKHFIGLADAIKEYNKHSFRAGTNISSPIQFQWTQLLCLADYMEKNYPNFNRQRWLDYVTEKCGPNGGKL